MGVITKFRSFNHSICKTVLNMLEAIYFRLRKIVVERVTVVKFRVNNKDSDGICCFRITVKTGGGTKFRYKRDTGINYAIKCKSA